MHYIMENFDFILAAFFVSAIFIAGNLLPLRQRWAQNNFIFLFILVLFFGTTWVGVRAVESFVSQRQKAKLLGYAPSYAWVFEQMGHSQIDFKTAPENPLYLKFVEYEKGWLKSNPFISDIYTMKLRHDGRAAFLVDSETDYDKNGSYDGERESRTPIGEVFDKNIPALQEAFNGQPSFTYEPYTDRWGSWVSAFVPLRNKNNQIDAVLALDFPSELYLSEIRNARNFSLVCFSLFYLLIASYASTLFRHKQYTLALSAALNEAKRAAAIKSDFLANMSHEIRTPLNAILGMINLLSMEPFKDETKKKLSIIKVCSDSLLTLINDILDFSKIEAGKLKLEHVTFEIESAISEIVELLRSTGEDKGLTVRFLNEAFRPQWVSTDLNRFRQVLLNLVTNAIKFTPEGSVTVRLTYTNVGPEETEIRVSVIDTGIGIEPEAQKKLFQSFSQVDASTTRRFGGTGLGLAISKGIIDVMGGKIWLESTQKKGSTFSFSLPAKRVLNPLNESKYKTPVFDSSMGTSKPLRILIADDQMPNRLLAVNFLSLLGYAADSVCNGLEALDAFNTKSYDVVFMDCQMPEMDGYLATTKLKSRFKQGKGPWIIALTASAYPEDKEKCFQSGMDDFIPKPFSVELLAQALEKVNSRRDSQCTNQGTSNNKISVAIDFELMRRHFNGDVTIMGALIEDFISNYPGALDEIQAALTDGDSSRVRITAHKLRGNVANFFAKSIQESLLELETKAKNNDLNDVSSLFIKIKSQFEELHNDLKNIDTRKVA